MKAAIVFQEDPFFKPMTLFGRQAARGTVEADFSDQLFLFEHGVCNFNQDLFSFLCDSDHFIY